ncbi:GTPase HflX [bacterium]|nr:GTPase HflX [bacterium]
MGRIESTPVGDDGRVPAATERALLIGLWWSKQREWQAVDYLDELALLARTAGAQIAARELLRRKSACPATLIGSGKVEELKQLIEENGIELVIFDEDLSPAQARNLEQAWQRRLVDRSGLILDIFARRARTREACTQVELAQLQYLLPRLTGAWRHLERQRGGIGLRGPGETQLETDRRIVRKRIGVLQRELEHIERTRKTRTSRRKERFRVTLVGYTNVGKSTLMNALTEANMYEENLLFATLDSTTRALKLAPKTTVLLTDTVGFIRKLPPQLVASFRSTLGEVVEADCLLHLVDLSHPAYVEQMETVSRVLTELGVGNTPQILVFNKLDAVQDAELIQEAKVRYPEAEFVSARRHIGLDSLLQKLLHISTLSYWEGTFSISQEEGPLLAEIHRYGEVLSQRNYKDKLRLRVRMPEKDARRLRGLLGLK